MRCGGCKERESSVCMHVWLGEGGSCWMLFSVNKDGFFLIGLAHLASRVECLGKPSKSVWQGC